MKEKPLIRTFDAETFARCWLAVYTAAGTNDDRPAFDHTVAVEFWPEGVRLIGCDGFMLWTAYAPETGCDDDQRWPTMDELPEKTVIADDHDHRARDLVKYALKTVTAKDAQAQDIRITVGPAPTQKGQFVGMEQEAFSIAFPAEAPLSEHLAIGTVEVEYPMWRALFPVTKPKALSRVKLDPIRLAQLSTARKFWPGDFNFSFHGSANPVAIECQRLDDYPTQLKGLLMPTRADESKEVDE